jgi:hypothetical protein
VLLSGARCDRGSRRDDGEAQACSGTVTS